MIITIPGYNKLIKVERVSQFAVPKKRVVQKSFNKVFVIGFGKTGTSSMKRALEYFGFKVGDQTVAEVLSEDWSRGRSDRIIRYCNTADAFQDFPFMMPGLYKLLDQKFPNSKFILTVRDSPDQWFSSLIKFHSKVFSSVKDVPPSISDLENANYRYRGWTLDVFKFFWNYPEVPLYDEKVYKQRYIDYKREVNEYFAGREKDFVEINVSRKNDFQKLRDFLSVETDLIDFPWENKTVSQ